MSDSTFRLETPRLYISHILNSPAHSAFLVQLYNTPLFISTSGKTGITTVTQASELIQNRLIPEQERNGYGIYVVSLKATPTSSLGESQPIGTVSLRKGNSSTSYTAPDIGFAILPEMNGNGYATESGRALLQYAKDELGITEVFGFCDPTNACSQRVLEKIGLVARGTGTLRCFGGVVGAVFAMPGMKDLANYEKRP